MSTEVTQQDLALDETPEGWQRRWTLEITHARKQLDKFYSSGEKAIKAYLDEREVRGGDCDETHWTLFTSNVQTKEDMLLGNTPKVSVTRRYADAADDVARVAGTMLERLLNSDIEKDGSPFSMCISYALKDRLLPGLGQGRVRYTAEFEEVAGTPAQLDEAGQETAPAVPQTQRVAYECAETEFAHWRDFLWNADARVWPELRWVAFRNEMGRQALEKRFGAQGKNVPLNAKRHGEEGDKRETPWGRAEVWEIWDRESRKVFWFVQGMPRVLEEKDDPLGLEDFFPCPLPLLATTTTSSLIPRNDYALAQDLYREINEYSTRIKLLSDALRVAGVYDKASGADLSQLLDGSTRNVLVPVDRWAAFAEKGGIRGSIEFLPLEAIAATIAQLDERRSASTQALFQITGMSDIMRGQQVSNGTPGEAQVKARFASVRMQRLQDEVARFATDLQKLKAEVIAKHYSVQSIITQSNIMATPDAPLAMQAAQLIKSNLARYRVEVKPESLALADFAQMQAERTGLLAAMASFFSASAPLVQAMPDAMPFLLQMLQWFVSGLRGASQIEGVLDAAIAAAQRAAQERAANPQAPPPDPKVQAQQMKLQGDAQKAQADMQKEQLKLQNDLTRMQAEVQADAAREATQREENVREAGQKALIGSMTRAMQPQRPGGGMGGKL